MIDKYKDFKLQDLKDRLDSLQKEDYDLDQRLCDIEYEIEVIEELLERKKWVNVDYAVVGINISLLVVSVSVINSLYSLKITGHLHVRQGGKEMNDLIYPCLLLSIFLAALGIKGRLTSWNALTVKT
jgi:hypothetical protein